MQRESSDAEMALPGPESASSWSQLRSVVRESRRAMFGPGSSFPQNRVPSRFVFRPMALRTRLYFLSSHAGKDTTIMFVDVEDSSSRVPPPSDASQPWACLIEPSFQLFSSSTKISKEEQVP